MSNLKVKKRVSTPIVPLLPAIIPQEQQDKTDSVNILVQGLSHPANNQMAINAAIKNLSDAGKIETNLVSDSYHTFGELYEHRIELFIALCNAISYSQNLNHSKLTIWRTLTHSDGTKWDGWFVLGIGKEAGSQITYHLPMSYWLETEKFETLAQAPTFDNHTASDVLERLKKL